jgi:hypothetical protein
MAIHVLAGLVLLAVRCPAITREVGGSPRVELAEPHPIEVVDLGTSADSGG